jgi:hypothetical protein
LHQAQSSRIDFALVFGWRKGASARVGWPYTQIAFIRIFAASEADRQLSMDGDRVAVLVTGGAGYIGSHCCKALFDAGYLPVCLDNLSTGHAEFVRWGPFVRGDIADQALVLDAFATFNIVAVVHMAASSSVSQSPIRDRTTPTTWPERCCCWMR